MLLILFKKFEEEIGGLRELLFEVFEDLDVLLLGVLEFEELFILCFFLIVIN